MTSCRVKMPSGLSLRVDNRHRPDSPILHRRQGGADRRIREGGHRVEAQEVGQWRIHSLSRRDIRSVFGLQARARQVQQMCEPARAEIAECRRTRDQRVERFRRKDQTERVASCAVDGRHTAIRQQCAKGKHVAGGKLPQGHGVARGPCGSRTLAAHGTLLDDVAMRRPRRSGREDRLAGCEVAKARRPDHTLDLRVGHCGKGHMRPQRELVPGNDRGRGRGGQVERSVGNKAAMGSNPRGNVEIVRPGARRPLLFSSCWCRRTFPWARRS